MIVVVLRLLYRGLAKGANICLWALRKTGPLSPEARVDPWFRDQGDKTLRLDYALDERSLVFDLGGYEGQWASDIFARYCCSIHIFEPVQKFATRIEERFSKNKKIVVHRCGLADKTGFVPVAVNKDKTSIFRRAADLEEIRLVRAIDFMQQNNIAIIDLMKINIEGGEYDLLDHLIESDFVKRIYNIQVQFHDFVPDAEGRMRQIQKHLARTHFPTYQYPFVWENWKIKEMVS